jgi:hypothetical protein
MRVFGQEHGSTGYDGSGYLGAQPFRLVLQIRAGPGRGSQPAVTGCEHRLRLEGCLDQGAQLGGVGVTACCQFRVDEFVADFDLKGAAAARNQGPGFDLGLELFDQLCRDTHDFGGIVSSGAILDRDGGLGHCVPPCE